MARPLTFLHHRWHLLLILLLIARSANIRLRLWVVEAEEVRVGVVGGGLLLGVRLVELHHLEGAVFVGERQLVDERFSLRGWGWVRGVRGEGLKEGLSSSHLLLIIRPIRNMNTIPLKRFTLKNHKIREIRVPSLVANFEARHDLEMAVVAAVGEGKAEAGFLDLGGYGVAGEVLSG